MTLRQFAKQLGRCAGPVTSKRPGLVELLTLSILLNEYLGRYATAAEREAFRAEYLKWRR